MIAGLVSTIIPVFNRAALLREAVASVLAQTYRPIEIIIVDDGSTDDTPATIAKLSAAHPEIRSVRITNSGPGAAREAGRLLANGELIQHLDSDDLLRPRRFELLVNALREHPEAGVAYGMTRYLDANGNELPPAWKNPNQQQETMFPSFLLARWWDTPSPLYRRSVTDAVGPWTSLRMEEDWEYDARVAALGTRLAFVPEVLVDIRMRMPGHLSGDPSRLADRARAHELIASHAQRAGIPRDAPEMQHFARELFHLSRQCGAAGLRDEARRLLTLAREIAPSWDMRAYGAVARVIGWRGAGKLAMMRERLRPPVIPSVVEGPGCAAADVVPPTRPGPSTTLGMTGPAVSVVMSVYNGAATLRETLDSILAQRGVDFEVIVVDDGSTDGTAAILDATNGIRAIHQQNQGLTRSLVTGCRAARAPFIARHDCGDRSHPDRLRKQLELITSPSRGATGAPPVDPVERRQAGAPVPPLDIVVVSCSTQYIGPEGEPLYVVSSNGDDVRRSLLHDGVDSIRGLTHHGTAMFRRDTYFDAGEYRPQFRFAQDLDLWLRMAQRGRIEFVPEVLYEARFEPNAISGVHRELQVESARIAIALRDTPASEHAALLQRASEIAPLRKADARSSADGFYFLATALKKSGNRRWRHYAWQAIRNNPLHLRAWGRLLTNR